MEVRVLISSACALSHVLAYHNEQTEESAQWNPYDGIRTIKSAQWSLYNGSAQ